MATRIGRAPENLRGNSLISYLKKKTAKRESAGIYTGMLRSLALSDVDDRNKALDNLLEKISSADRAETEQYGSPFNVLDWSVTSDFTDEGIDKNYLTRLAGASIGGGSLGSTVSITPRIRIQDRINFLNAFYGEGSFSGLHSGPDAQFYKPPAPEEIGYIRFTYDQTSGFVSAVQLQDLNLNDTTATILLGSEQVIVYNISSYTTQDGREVEISGLGIALKLVSGGTWSLYDENSLNAIKSIDASLSRGGPSVISLIKFKFVRPYSILYKPLWFTESPNFSSDEVKGSADDIDPTTTNRLLRSEAGIVLPFIQKGYWYTRAYVEDRWSSSQQEFILRGTNVNNSIIEDSNMRWQQPPSRIRNFQYNWGVRWDGYLRITPGTYAFQVQTNVSVKIDVATDISGQWQNVFNTDLDVKENEDTYISRSTFNVANINSKYKYVTGESPNTDWVGYVPITIRMFRGGSDKADPEMIIPVEPNLFIKTVNFTDTNYQVTLSGTDGNWTVLGAPELESRISIFGNLEHKFYIKDGELLQTPISIELTSSEDSVFSSTSDPGLVDGSTYYLNSHPGQRRYYSENHRVVFTFSDSNSRWEATGDTLSRVISILSDNLGYYTYRITAAGDTILGSPLQVQLATDGVFVYQSGTSFTFDDTLEYTLSFYPVRGDLFNEGLQSLWKSRIASPPPAYKKYSDLTDGSYEPNLQKVPFDSRAEWWRVSEGHPYNRFLPAARDNTPIDGFVRNTFKNVLQSEAKGVGLYGNGLNPPTYSLRNNIILGEARYSTSDNLGSSYIGLRLTPDLTGEGGELNIRSLPINKSNNSDPLLLGENDLGGSPNHLTSASGKFTHNSVRVFLSDDSIPPESIYYNKYFSIPVYNLFADLPNPGTTSLVYFVVDSGLFYTWNGSAYVQTTPTVIDVAENYGLPTLSNVDLWLSPISLSAVQVANDSGFTQSPVYLTCPLDLTAERVLMGSIPVVRFSTSQPSLLWTGNAKGADVDQFSGKYVKFYTENNTIFRYSRVDSGESVSFSDVLKLTYDESNNFIGSQSEVPGPPSERVTPFGFDRPEYSTGLCYPPYVINNPILSGVAISDQNLYNGVTPGYYDVFWGDQTKARLDDKILKLSKGIEFQNYDQGAVESIQNPVSISYSDYTHRMRIDMPVTDLEDEDMLEHIGNGQKVSDSYYAYVRLPA